MTLRSSRPAVGGRRRVLVIGATGHVGRVVARTLAPRRDLDLVVAARRPHDFAASIGRQGTSLDLDDVERARSTVRDLAPDVIVMCTEPADPTFLGSVVDDGISLVDITASHDRLRMAEGLTSRAQGAGASVVLSVGVAPGLTNHLAARVHADLDGAEQLDISVVLGSGEEHGPEALRWVLDAVSGSHAEALPRATVLPDLGRRTVFPMPFPDQYTLPRTLGVPRVATRMALDSRLVSAALFRAARTAAGRRALTSSGFSRWIQAYAGRLRIGGDRFLVLAEGRRAGVLARRWVGGRGQSATTGLVAARAALRVLASDVPAGVWHYDQVPALLDDVEIALADRCTFGQSRSPL